MIGDGPFRGRLEEAIRDANLGSAAMLVGRAEDKDLHAWYEAATLFVHPTLYEGSSLVTLEAMAHRRAVVATRAGGLPDKVKPGVNGWLVEPGDPSALAAAISGAVGEATNARRVRPGRTEDRRDRVLVGRGGTGDRGALQRASGVAVATDSVASAFRRKITATLASA